MTTRVKLGSTVVDTITGIKGIAICRAEWLHGCVRISIQPVSKDNKPVDQWVTDEQNVKVLKEVVVKPTVGGPTSAPRMYPNPTR